MPATETKTIKDFADLATQLGVTTVDVPPIDPVLVNGQPRLPQRPPETRRVDRPRDPYADLGAVAERAAGLARPREPIPYARGADPRHPTSSGFHQ